jgi:hypothetical protein
MQRKSSTFSLFRLISPRSPRDAETMSTDALLSLAAEVIEQFTSASQQLHKHRAAPDIERLCSICKLLYSHIQLEQSRAGDAAPPSASAAGLRQLLRSLQRAQALLERLASRASPINQILDSAAVYHEVCKIRDGMQQGVQSLVDSSRQQQLGGTDSRSVAYPAAQLSSASSSAGYGSAGSPTAAAGLQEQQPAGWASAAASRASSMIAAGSSNAASLSAQLGRVSSVLLPGSPLAQAARSHSMSLASAPNSPSSPAAAVSAFAVHAARAARASSMTSSQTSTPTGGAAAAPSAAAVPGSSIAAGGGHSGEAALPPQGPAACALLQEVTAQLSSWNISALPELQHIEQELEQQGQGQQQQQGRQGEVDRQVWAALDGLHLGLPELQHHIQVAVASDGYAGAQLQVSCSCLCIGVCVSLNARRFGTYHS